jgi:hypothetical protein
MNKISSQIENHQFVDELMNDLKPVIKKLHQNGEYTLSEFEQYLLSVFKWIMRIRDCFEALDYARVYLKYFSTNKRHEKAGIGRSRHINYHYFNYAITVVKIMDVALILTNKTFRLGNPERLCRFDSIIENSWVRSAGIDKPLKELNSLVEPWREPRNLFIHRGETLSSKSLHLLEAYDLLISTSEPITIFSPSEAKLLYKLEVSKIYKEFEQTEVPLLSATSELLSELLPIYRFWRKTLQETSDR